jgi:hypothetical protein
MSHLKNVYGHLKEQGHDCPRSCRGKFEQKNKLDLVNEKRGIECKLKKVRNTTFFDLAQKRTVKMFLFSVPNFGPKLQ